MSDSPVFEEEILVTGLRSSLTLQSVGEVGRVVTVQVEADGPGASITWDCPLAEAPKPGERLWLTLQRHHG